MRVDGGAGTATCSLAIGLCCVISTVALQADWLTPDLAFLTFGFIPVRFLSWETWLIIGPIEQIGPLLTYFWIHDGWFHLGLNCWWLWLFGTPVERYLGGPRFLLLALVCSVGAALGFAVSDPSSVNPLVGASGLVAGCMGAFLWLSPAGRVLVLIPSAPPWIVKIRALVFVGIWVLIQTALGLWSTGGSVPWLAHLGGAALGLLMAILMGDIVSRHNAVSVEENPDQDSANDRI